MQGRSAKSASVSVLLRNLWNLGFKDLLQSHPGAGESVVFFLWLDLWKFGVKHLLQCHSGASNRVVFCTRDQWNL